MINIKKGFAFSLMITLLSASFNITFADNKSDLLSKITSLENNLTNLKNNSSKDLEQKALVLSNNFDSSFVSMGYDTKTIDYLVSLGKISSNFKTDLTNDVNLLNKEISDKTLTELNSLSSIKNNITLNYTTINENQKATLDNSINVINSNYTNLKDTFNLKITTLNNKYTSGLDSYKNTLKQAYDSNKSTIDSLKNFESNYNNLFSIQKDFEKNYNNFKQTYLSFAGDLTLFSEERQKYYVNLLKSILVEIRDGNLEANKSLSSYAGDINRLIDILLQNFENSLAIKINDSYGIIYSGDDMDSLLTRYNNAKNKFYDADGKLKAKEVQSSSGAIEEVKSIAIKLGDINQKILILIGTGNTSNTYENVKIRLENEMVKFYNENYPGYRDDLLARLREKLDQATLEAKNALLAGDAIDIRFDRLNDKISKSNDFKYIRGEITTFKSDIAKYKLLQNSSIDTKIFNLENNLEIFYVKKELSQYKYKKMSDKKYNDQLDKIVQKLKNAFPNTYKDKLIIVISRIDNALTKKLSDKNSFMLLVVKLHLLNNLK
ncbi:hypothetical protein H3C61_03345 [Candidatus Gracilibacteria bacterium]|nr:hypothetical protein [Candidatus Gracilibacteria bacterium]